MEFSERKRSRKSQSFKVVSRDYHHEVYKISEFSNDVNGQAKETQPIFIGELPVGSPSVGPSCCTCNCQSTLQAILQELRTMRKLMQIQAAGSQSRQQPPVSLMCSQRAAASRKRNKKKKVPPKAEPLTVKPKPSASGLGPEQPADTPGPGPRATQHSPAEEKRLLGFGIVLESPSSDPEVQLAEGFDVSMPKSQLDSILSNYTRSGSLLFRKLVCAFFDDKTLANSLPNGKRKRGLNDNRKGLDQNIVGAIKGDESMEIKKQVTGMRRLLNDSTGRIYQRVGKEGEKLKEEPQDLESLWPPRLNAPADPQSLQPSARGAWNELPPHSGQFSGQYGTRSRTFQTQPHTAGSSNGELPVGSPSVGPSCCTCNCQSTLQAILQELRTMRKLMQIQAAGSQSRQQPPVSLMCSQRAAASRKRNKKKKVPPKAEPLTVKPKPSASGLGPEQPADTPGPGPRATQHSPAEEKRLLGFGIVLESPSSDPEVQLAEGFDVSMPKSQLDSILSNYTRSGSLLFRKLVCAFFDDKTLANSLPNGKRKRGLNDNRKGLDQNIVGAIKVFTEKYCTANHVDKLPGPRDWVQILQDQIKLARRRLKRGSAEVADGDERLDSVSLPPTGNMFDTRRENAADSASDFIA